jgi:hypothetical protein
MQYKVPQNIDIEDRVIAGLTLRQFMFLLVAGGICLLEYYLFKDGALSFLFLPIILVTAGVGIAFAFVKINDRPFEIFVASAAKSLIAPHTRVWQKDDDIEIPKHTETPHTRETVAKKKSVREVRSSLERLATVVDSGGVADQEDIVGARSSNLKKESKGEASNVEDVLAKTEQESPTVDKYLAQAKSYVAKTKTEPTVGQMAKVKTTKESFNYEKLDLASEKKLESALHEVEEKEKNLEKRMESAKVVKRGNDE